MSGAATAPELGEALRAQPAGIRRHLDAMLAEGMVTAGAGEHGPRGRGRPAKIFLLTDAGRDGLPAHL